MSAIGGNPGEHAHRLVLVLLVSAVVLAVVSVIRQVRPRVSPVQGAPRRPAAPSARRWSNSAVNRMSSAPAAATSLGRADAVGGRAGDRGGLDGRHPVPVDALQGRVHPVPGPLGVVVDPDVHALGDGEVRCGSARLGQRRPDDLDLLGERRGGRGAGAEEAVAHPHGPPQRGLAGPAEPQRRIRLLERLGLHRRVLELPEFAVEGDPGLGPQRLHQLDALGEPRTRTGTGSTPKAANGRPRPPVPTPTSIRPRLSWSSEARLLARCTGTVQGRHEHDAPQPHPLACTRPRRSSPRWG